MEKNKKKISSQKKSIIGLIISLSIVAALLVTFIVLYSTTQTQLNSASTDLENIYERNFYELVDNVNNVELKMSKTLASTSDSYANKMLGEVAQNADRAQTNISALPVSIGGIDESVKFINQLSGYTESLSKKIDKGGKLSADERDKLAELHESVLTMKVSLNSMSKDLQKGYHILSNSLSMKGDYNNFTTTISSMKPGDIDYPTMIYDGPFSDSQINPEVKGLSGAEVSKEKAEENLRRTFGNLKNVEYKDDSNGRFKTYNFTALTTQNLKIYAEVTKVGGHVLTVSCTADGGSNKRISIENAISVAKEFAKKNGVESVESVWSDVIESDAYINLAPVEKGAVLYPDLIKVKVDLNSGTVIGYEATSYYSNHKARSFGSASVSVSEAEDKVNAKFNIKERRLALIPLDYGQEILTHEFTCTFNDATYYMYIDAKTGEEVNILKVIETDSGNKLM